MTKTNKSWICECDFINPYPRTTCYRCGNFKHHGNMSVSRSDYKNMVKLGESIVKKSGTHKGFIKKQDI